MRNLSTYILFFWTLAVMSACSSSDGGGSCFRCTSEDPYFVKCLNTTVNSDGNQVCADLEQLLECETADACCRGQGLFYYQRECIEGCQSDAECDDGEICDRICVPEPVVPQVSMDSSPVDRICAALCELSVNCGAKSVEICRSEPRFDDENWDYSSECVTDNNPNCFQRCTQYYDTSSTPQSCLQAKIQSNLCDLSSCDTLIDAIYGDGESPCAEESEALAAACGDVTEDPDNPLWRYRREDRGPYIGIDISPVGLGDVLVQGVCPMAEDLSQLSFSVSLLSSRGREPFAPESQLGFIGAETSSNSVVGDLLNADSFSFYPTLEDQPDFDTNAVAERDDGAGSRIGLNLSPSQLTFQYPGSDARKDDDRLVVFVLDHSGSLAGLEPNGTPNLALRTDRQDQRITFFNSLLSNLPPGHFVSLVKMNDQGANIVGDCDVGDACGEEERVCSIPVRIREPVQCGLSSLQFGERGQTPLNQTLKDVIRQIIEPNTDLNPLVVVFTDGVESGDPSGDILAPGEAADIYQAGVAGNPVPIIFLHLQPPRTSPHPRGRNPGFQELACRSGGEYLFLESPDEFTESDVLRTMVSGRLEGAWRLTVDATLPRGDFAPGGGYLLSTVLSVTLDSTERSVSLSRPLDEFESDYRPWIKRAE